MLKLVAALLLKLGGWTAVGPIPDVPKAIFIAAPHTSNWDGYWLLVYKVLVGVDVKFFAKHTLFWFPLGSLLRALGGVALERSRAGSAVSQAVAMFAQNERFFFALAPEGTRHRTAGWKTGFHRIAKEAKVPVYFGFIDYGRKRLGVGPQLTFSGDSTLDIAACAEYYADIQGRHPENASPVVFPKLISWPRS